MIRVRRFGTTDSGESARDDDYFLYRKVSAAGSTNSGIVVVRICQYKLLTDRRGSTPK